MIKLEAYGILAQYPSKYRHLVKMHLKLLWTQKPTAGGIHVALPTSIAPRLAGECGKHAWPALMSEVEELGHNLPELTSAVAEKNANLPEEYRAREGMKWRSQVEIDLMS